MIGNKLSDMQFGRNAGMYTIYVQTTDPDLPLPNPAIDLALKDLPAFAYLLGTFMDTRKGINIKT